MVEDALSGVVREGSMAEVTLVYFVYLFIFSELWTEPRALHLLGQRSTTELNPQPPEVKWKDKMSYAGGMK